MKDLLVYIIDKNQTQGNFLKYRLNSSGIRNILVFHSAEEFIRTPERMTKPQFIIASAGMKDREDHELLNAILERAPESQVIFHSDNQSELHASELIEAGLTDYIVKARDNQDWIRELTSNLHFLILEGSFSGKDHL
jgi:DNA-binding NarL/FixJ family response regulator